MSLFNIIGGGESDSSGSRIVAVHPIVLFSILDHHVRRTERQARVIGTLLGHVEPGGTVVVTDSFPVPHVEEEDSDIKLGVDFNNTMLAMYRKVNCNENIVGWYATAGDHGVIQEGSVYIHQHYAEVCENDAVHIVIDTAFENARLEVKCFRNTLLAIEEEHVAAQFEEMAVQLTSSEAESIAVDAMLADSGILPRLAQSYSLKNGIQGLARSLSRILNMTQYVCQYIDDVVANTSKPDNRVGRNIADITSTIPRVRSTVFREMFAKNLQDLLMVVYMSNLTRAHVAISEKLKCVALLSLSPSLSLSLSLAPSLSLSLSLSLSHKIGVVWRGVIIAGNAVLINFFFLGVTQRLGPDPNEQYIISGNLVAIIFW